MQHQKIHHQPGLEQKEYDINVDKYKKGLDKFKEEKSIYSYQPKSDLCSQTSAARAWGEGIAQPVLSALSLLLSDREMGRLRALSDPPLPLEMGLH